MPTSAIRDMRTWCHGISHEDLIGKQSDVELIKKIQELMKDKIVIGHALKFDFEVLQFSHPESKIRSYALIIREDQNNENYFNGDTFICRSFSTFVFFSARVEIQVTVRDKGLITK